MRRALLLFGLVLVFAGGVAVAAQPPARGAKEYLASARQNDERALAALRSGRPASFVLARLRASQADLAAALDTLGAAELPPAASGEIRSRLVAASRLKGAVLAARSGDAGQLTRAIREALSAEAKAAALLGDAPGAPSIGELPIPVGVFGAFDLVVGPDGQSVWVSGPDGSRIVLYPSLEPGTTPTVFKLPPGSGPRGLAFGPGGALYVAETGTNIGGNAIARLLPTGELKQFFLPAGAGSPWDVAAGPDGKIWFTEVAAGKVGRLDPATGTFAEFRLPTASSQPQGIVVGADGALWGTEASGNRIFRMTVQGKAKEFPIPTPGAVPVAIATGRYGYLWVSELQGGKLLRISKTGKMREFPLPAGARPYGLVSAPDGNVWFTDRGRNRVGLVTPAGRLLEFPLPTPNAQPTAIAPLGLGRFAFSEFVANRVGVLTFP